MKFIHSILGLSILLMFSCAEGQNKLVGGPCEGCEAIYGYGNKLLKSVDTLPDFNNASQKIKISGVVYKLDGVTPAKEVILYVYHTNDEGIYPSRPNSKGWEKRHGYLRTWLKTDKKGSYSFYTSRPASYPNSNIPQHIHITVKEPNKNEYYINDYYFDDDPNLTAKIKNDTRPRGGNGVLKLQKKGNIMVATRDLVLGLNIPNY
ncbi:intradiol ring-cleavage dioxygenase [Flavobacteriaceae bacterium LMO-SS05]